LQSAVDFQKDISCVVRGFFQHFTACSMLAWYTLSSIHFYCALVGGGKNAEYAFGASTKVTLVYLLCGFGFVIVDCAIVWGLYPLNASYGPMFPWAFCWVRTETLWTLGFSFYVPAVIALVVNLVLSVITIRFILKVRSSLDKVDKDTMIAVIALFGCSNVGTIGFGFLGLFVALYRNANGGNPAIFIALSVFLFVQALVYWLVYFARPASMEIWSRLFFCNGFRDLQEPGSRLPTMSSDNSSRSTTALKASSATSTASADVASIEL
jgi:hypothetical protein